MRTQTLLRTGIIGTVVTIICCFTPALVVLLGAAGLSIWLGWLDYILFPLLLLFVAVTIVALVQRARHRPSQQSSSGT